MKRMKTNYLKVGVLGLMISAGTAMSAQTTDQSDAKLEKKANAAGDAVVRVIDNKGTIKYLQSSNGITTITSTNSGNATTTTWQLGGTLTDDTYIDATGQEFGITGIKAIDAVTNATSDIAATAYDAPGFTLVVRDEATGELKKLLATDLITSGQTYFTVTADAEKIFNVTATTGTTPNNVMDGGQVPLPDFDKVWVYRNGAKLIGGLDYQINQPNTVELKFNTTAPNDWTTYAGDVIEIQYYK